MAFIFLTCLSFLGFIVGFSSTQIWASSTTPPTITISEFLSCPTDGENEWVELQRFASQTQTPQSNPFSLVNFTLKDDKNIIWTGSDETIHSFAPDNEFTVLELTKQYLNNSGDTLSLLYPEGVVLDEAIVPACKVKGESWTFQDGDWLAASPSPGQTNPTPTPTPEPTPNSTPTTTSQQNQTPTPEPSPRSTALPTPTNTSSQGNDTNTTDGSSSNTENSSHKSEKNNESQSLAQKSQQAQHQYLSSSYITQLNKKTSTKDQANINKNATQSSEINDASKNTTADQKSNVLGTSKTNQTNLSYSPTRSLVAYVSVILGGVLLTASGGICSIKPVLSTTQQNDR